MSGYNAPQAVKELLDGNRRFVAGETTLSDSIHHRRAHVAAAQRPFAAIVTCSDSRVAPELVFDQTLGNLFVVRTAGGAMDVMSLGSIEYAIERLHVPLVVVLGHTRCGAVEAAVKGAAATGNLEHVLNTIAPALEKTRGMPGDPVTNAVRASTEMAVARFSSAKTPLGKIVRAHDVRVVGAIYDLDSGIVSLLPTVRDGNQG